MSDILRWRRLLSARRRESVITRADRAARSGQFEAALRLYREALNRNSRNPPIWIQCGHVSMQLGDLPAAEEAYRRAITLAPGVAEHHLHLGHVLKRQDRAEEAGTAYLRALALDPSSADAAREMIALGWPEDRLSQLRSPASIPVPATQANGDKKRPGAAFAVWFRRDKATIITLADNARDARQWDHAGRLYRNALRRNPDNAPIWVQYGHALKNLGELEAAETAYRQAVARNPIDADPHLHLGHILKLRGRNKAAEAAYLRAFAHDPDMREPLLELCALGWNENALAELRLTAGSKSST